MLESEVEVLSHLSEGAAKGIMAKPDDRKPVVNNNHSVDPHDPNTRINAINRTINLRKRLANLHELIENELYGKLQSSSAQIAPFGSNP
jgi:hypothetical protein